jgi:FAD/FMN-containing dehydrogenase
VDGFSVSVQSVPGLSCKEIMAMLERLRAFLGERYVLTGADMAAYVAEERGLLPSHPLAVLRPGSVADMAEVMAWCYEAGLPMVPQGGNTGLCGGAVAQNPAVILATDRLTSIRDIDPHGRTITVEAGCILADVQKAAAEQDCLFPLSLAAEGSCRIGGNLSTNAGGVHVVRYGSMRDLVLGIEAILPDGRVWNGLRALRKNNAGYDLKQIFVGAEGTLGLITAAVLKLFPAPRDVQTGCVAVASPQAAVSLLALVRQCSGDTVTACELMPRRALEFVMQSGLADPVPMDSPWYVLLELSSSRPNGLGSALEECLQQAMEAGLVGDGVLAQSEQQRQALWRVRETIPEAQKRYGASIKHDVSVSLPRVPVMIERCVKAVSAMVPGVRPVPFGHMGDGNIHLNFTQPEDMETADFMALRPSIHRIVHDIVADLEGSIAAEHGVGALKVEELRRYVDPLELEMMQRLKTAFDPKGLMNPGKILAP